MFKLKRMICAISNPRSLYCIIMLIALISIVGLVFDNNTSCVEAQTCVPLPTMSSKICVAISPGYGARSVLSVPETWTIENCRVWAANYGSTYGNWIFGTNYALGCTFPNGSFSHGAQVGSGSTAPVPSTNCGW